MKKQGFTFPTFVATGLSALLITLASFFFCFLFMCSADTPEALWRIQVWDTSLGLLFAAAFIVVRLTGTGDNALWRKAVTVVGALLIWAIFSGALLLWHEALARVRWNAPRTLASNQIGWAQEALHEFAKDCGRYPTPEEGLRALHMNPGVENWSGPYSSSEQLLDPWGNLLQYRILDKSVEIWSLGPDGVNGTDDDIRWPPAAPR